MPPLMDSLTSLPPLWNDRGVSLLGWGHYFPTRRQDLCDPELPAPLDHEIEVLGDTLGVHGRHLADDDETVADMAIRAARGALEQADVPPSELDLVIVSNWTEENNTPEQAPRVALGLGADRALAFNVGGACTGFVHGVQVATSTLVAQGLRYAVVVGADQFSRRVRPGRWGGLHAGDGAGAAVVGFDPASGGTLHDSLLLSWGEHADVVALSRNGFARSEPELAHLAPDAAMFVVDALLKRNQLKISDIDRVVVHPGSYRVLTAIRERLNLDPERVLTNFVERGSTASASVPSTISEYLETGRLRRGELILTPAMGSGFYAGALLVTL